MGPQYFIMKYRMNFSAIRQILVASATIAHIEACKKAV